MGSVAGLSVAGFADALLWVPRGPLARRRVAGAQVFPSWIKAGWVASCQIEWVSDPTAPRVQEWVVVHGPEDARARLPLVSYDALRFRERPKSGPFSALDDAGGGRWHRRTRWSLGRGLATVCILDDAQRWVGTVMMPESEASAISAPTTHDFLPISTRGSPVGCYADPALYSKEWRDAPNVLMVERVAGIRMERLAVGIVHKDAWDAAGTSEEYVRLI
ncbi:hypothetical protein HYPSUDRAFT_80706 [Hypholoma sublateritium FD-334 SS-4]|uniref:Uncharacterized protein n=1 Tax=Hypholoma sublateritium (strain FD-334 SS-4) TaxID=945553 RepID=A0A0D2N6Q9_HYPSF|nr:hypothetical protein HYPSUDRAFT_80706 [Hypholoma sublateritium FD-334 SS-4]